MTIGQRVAQKRKELGLSQEALGDQLGVSRQSIYKWESDTTLPEIDKLIALSRLFGVSVGWLLGVEEPPQTDGAENAGADPGSVPKTGPGELTEAQLNMVEEIVGRYTAALPKPRRRRWPFVLAGLVLIIAFSNLFQFLDTLRLQQESIFNDISRVESSVNSQIGSISSQVEDILKAQNSLVADYGVEISSANLKENRVAFSVHALPKTYSEGMTVEFTVDNGTGGVACVPGDPAPDGGFTGTVACELTDSITISSVFTAADGTRSTQLLDQFQGLYSDSLPAVDLMNYDSGELLGLEANESGLVTLPEVYITVSPSPSSDGGKEPIGQSEIETVRVGLFKNNVLVTWLEPCQQPESFHGDFENDTFYHLAAGAQATLAKSTDQIQIAAVVTDQYGREAVYGDIPYILSGGELTWPGFYDASNHDPANWQY